jgi:small subunit ribosomal protein S16
MVVTDSKNGPQSGKFLELLGSYTVKSNTVVLKNDRILHWIANGAQVSDTAHNMLVTEKVIEGKKKNALSRKSPTVKRKDVKKKK